MRPRGVGGQFISQMSSRSLASRPPNVAFMIWMSFPRRGKKDVGDERYFHHASCRAECLVNMHFSVASMLLAQLGLGKKCRADLDNTLWGGVIGDDGLSGIRLGGGVPGQAFAAFQRCVQTPPAGVILAVCSKNTESIAARSFEKHTEMVLKLADISCFVANWEDKASNLKAIAKQLNIGINFAGLRG
jgi:predicted enzyme involved in methoxymalonyl-ACP biosynthesis